MKKLGIIICGLVLVMGCQRNVYRFSEGSVYGTVYHVSYQSEIDYAGGDPAGDGACKSVLVNV